MIHITTFVKLCWHLCHIITGAVAISIMDEVHIPQRKDYPQDRIVHYGSLQRWADLSASKEGREISREWRRSVWGVERDLGFRLHAFTL